MEIKENPYKCKCEAGNCKDTGEWTIKIADKGVHSVLHLCTWHVIQLRDILNRWGEVK